MHLRSENGSLDSTNGNFSTSSSAVCVCGGVGEGNVACYVSFSNQLTLLFPRSSPRVRNLLPYNRVYTLGGPKVHRHVSHTPIAYFRFSCSLLLPPLAILQAVLCCSTGLDASGGGYDGGDG